MEEQLMDLILKLLRADVCYTIKRLLPADLKKSTSLRNEDEISPTKDNPFYDDFPIVKNAKYGGVDVAPFLTYNSSIDDYENVSECETWKCEKCEMVAALSPFKRLQHIKLHEKQCQLENTDVSANNSFEIKKSNAKLYECEMCQKKLYLTPTEILKHHREHQNDHLST